MPAPSPSTKPSRSLSNGRLALRRLVVARRQRAQRAEAADAHGETAASAPPAIITSAAPRLMISNESPIACADAVHAVHVARFGPGPETIPLEWCYGDGVLLDFRECASGYVITEDDVKAELKRMDYELKPKDIVINWTGAGDYNTEERYRTDHPGMSAAATRWLISQGVRMMGCDAITFDPPVWAMFEKKLFWEAHRVMWDEEYWHLENMMNLGASAGSTASP